LRRIDMVRMTEQRPKRNVNIENMYVGVASHIK